MKIIFIHENLTKPGLIFSYSDVDSIKYMAVTEVVHGHHTEISPENKVLAQACQVPKYKTDMPTIAAEPQALLPLLIT